jgi:hypothetical protein
MRARFAAVGRALPRWGELPLRSLDIPNSFNLGAVGSSPTGLTRQGIENVQPFVRSVEWHFSPSLGRQDIDRTDTLEILADTVAQNRLLR